jgi:hypothetical protein
MEEAIYEKIKIQYQPDRSFLMKNNLKNITEHPKLPSNNKFGWFFSAVFAMIAIYSFNQKIKTFAYAATLLFFIFVAVTFFAPQLLTRLNRLWYTLGSLLGKVVSPLVLGVIFFVLISPIALITRLFGRDELKIKKSFSKSYWVDRLPPGPPSNSFKNQF